MQPALQTAPSSGVPAGARRRKPTVDELAEMIGGDDDLSDVNGHAAGIVFVAPDGEVLLLRRSSTEQNYGGHWALPGGKADDGETPEQAADREAHEELGGTAPKGEKRLLSSVRTPNGMAFHTFAQHAPEKFVPKLNDEHSGYAWASRDMLPEPLHPQVKKTLATSLAGDAEFNEGDHPRAPDGKFGAGSGGGGSTANALREKSLKSPLSAQESTALSLYSTEDFGAINHGLRSGEIGPFEQTIVDSMDSAFKKASLAEPATAYRGIDAGVWARAFGNLKPGDTIEDKAFASTSTDAGAADRFGGHVMEIRVPKGYPAISMGDLSKETRTEESELLLDRGTKFRIVSTSGNKTVMEVLPKGSGVAGDAAFNESDHPRNHGQFATSSGGGGSEPGKTGSREGGAKRSLTEKIKTHAETIKKHGKETADWIKQEGAGKVLATIAKDHRTQAALSFALQSLVSHGTGILSHATHGAIPNVQGLDPSTWHLNEAIVEHALHDYATAAAVTAAQAKATMREGVKALLKYREHVASVSKKPIAGDAEPETDGVKEVLEALLDILEDDEAEPKGATDSALRLALDRDSVREFDREGRLHVAEANICKACISPYRGQEIMDVDPTLKLEPGKIYYMLRPPEELEKAAATSNGIQLLRKHISVDAGDHKPWDVVGSVGTGARWEAPYVKNALTIWPAVDIAGIESKAKAELSPGYLYRPVMESGTFEGERFDGKMTDIVFNHLAIVEEGRQGKDVIVGDSNDELAWAAIEEAIASIA